MGMYAYLISVTPDHLREVIADPDADEDGLYPEPEAFAAGDALDLGKAWDGLHFLLTDGTRDEDSPLGQAVRGGEPIAEYDEDKNLYGPPRALQPSEVKAVADALAALPADVLRQRFGDGSRLTTEGVYPEDWADPDALPWLLTTFAQLVAFYRRAADRGNAVLVVLI